ncbi:hypothetical protein PsAD46_04344 [Pseudovibrio sp. Ad46]|uniref:hypothetical protein n=1 Tax=Pseudovibrio sp. Ad46 TaxID=989432 RepID=UPI0007AE45A7|nr:hypothetical protein [Pseudovibrio sp. Ad46]KZK79632.1 hypothetical protein PsAD46_04344 [Pseudovibrio sp. Ad46]
MPPAQFAQLKENNDLAFGVPLDSAAWLSKMREQLDFNIKQLAYRARDGKLKDVRLKNGTLIVTPQASDVPSGAEELNKELTQMYPHVEVLDLLRDVHKWICRSVHPCAHWGCTTQHYYHAGLKGPKLQSGQKSEQLKNMLDDCR